MEKKEFYFCEKVFNYNNLIEKRVQKFTSSDLKIRFQIETRYFQE